MSLQERIEADLKTAMLERNTLTRDTLRMVIAAFKNKKIELGRTLDRDDEVSVLQKAHKSRLESAEAFGLADRSELAQKERAEAAVIEGYLPKLMGEGETRAVVEAIVRELGLTDKKQIGQVMKTAMSRHRSEVDGKLVQKIAGELLG